jgi:hypothetical protein
LRWFRHLSERLGLQNTLSIWENTFAEYDDKLLLKILSTEWQKTGSDKSNQVANRVKDLVAEILLTTNLELLESEVRNIIENTPPISQIKDLFSDTTVEKEISAYDALHMRFDGLACLAETLIDRYSKQGELIVYDLMVEGRIASGQGEKVSVEQFIANFMAKPDTPNLFTAGLEIEKVSQTKREAVIYIWDCEWARYFQERHPKVGYLMACSTDEVAYKSFNKSLRMQRTQTIMEGDKKCDFRIYGIDRD